MDGVVSLLVVVWLAWLGKILGSRNILYVTVLMILKDNWCHCGCTVSYHLYGINHLYWGGWSCSQVGEIWILIFVVLDFLIGVQVCLTLLGL